MFLLVLSVEFAGLGDDIVEVTSAEFTVRIILGVFLHVHVDRSVRYVRVALIEDALHESYLLDDMARSVRLDGRRQYVERRHVTMIAVGVILHDLHRFELFEPCFLSYLIFSFIGIMLEVAYIGYIADIAHLITQILQIAVKDVERDSGTGMA